MAHPLTTLLDFFPLTKRVGRKNRLEMNVDQSFRDYPTANLFHLTKYYPNLMKDAFHEGRWDETNGDDKVAFLWSLYDASDAQLESYKREVIIGPKEEQAVSDAAVLQMVESQIYDYGDFQHMSPQMDVRRSPLWTSYARVYACSSDSIRRAVELICRADVTLYDAAPARNHRGVVKGLVVIGPSTLVGGGCGLIAVGRAERIDYEYLGPVVPRAAAIGSRKRYFVRLDDERSLDGSRVFSFASVINCPPRTARKEHVCQLQAEPKNGTVYASMKNAVTSSEIWCDYGMDVEEFNAG